MRLEMGQVRRFLKKKRIHTENRTTMWSKYFNTRNIFKKNQPQLSCLLRHCLQNTDLVQIFLKGQMGFFKCYAWKCSVSLVTAEMKITTTLRSHLTPGRMTIETTNKCWWGYREEFIHHWWAYKQSSHYETSTEGSHITKNRTATWSTYNSGASPPKQSHCEAGIPALCVYHHAVHR